MIKLAMGLLVMSFLVGGYSAAEALRTTTSEAYDSTSVIPVIDQVIPPLWRGKKISLNFQNISVRSVLQLLAEVAGVNLVVSDAVSGTITLRLKEVPWDQALAIILTTQALEKHETGDIITIAPSQAGRRDVAALRQSRRAPQFIIEARIVGVTKDFAQELGIHFNGHRLDQGASPTLSGGRFHMDLGALVTPCSAVTMGLAIAKLSDNLLLDLELSALESEEKADIIARPRLMVANRQEAYIESGEDIPYQQSTLSGATAVAFKKAVLSLRVTPTLVSGGRIMMKLKINQDHPSAAVFNGTPAIMTKEIETRISVKNRQTIVLGGIYRRDKTNHLIRLPFWGKLPIVGALFRRHSVVEHHEELLIFITPKLIGEEEK